MDRRWRTAAVLVAVAAVSFAAAVVLLDAYACSLPDSITATALALFGAGTAGIALALQQVVRGALSGRVGAIAAGAAVCWIVAYAVLRANIGACPT